MRNQGVIRTRSEIHQGFRRTKAHDWPQDRSLSTRFETTVPSPDWSAAREPFWEPDTRPRIRRSSTDTSRPPDSAKCSAKTNRSRSRSPRHYLGHSGRANFGQCAGFPAVERSSTTSSRHRVMPSSPPGNRRYLTAESQFRDPDATAVTELNYKFRLKAICRAAGQAGPGVRANAPKKEGLDCLRANCGWTRLPACPFESRAS